MKSYLNAKLILFREILKSRSTIISDQEIKIYSFLRKIAKRKNLKLLNIKKEFEGIKNNYSNFNSEFKIKNLAMAIKAAKLCYLSEDSIHKSIKNLKDVNGRLELIREYPCGIKVFVDYAHTPDALIKTVKSLKNEFGNNISLVFGCGGERDFKKRPIMAKIANDNCKKIYITDDNPRNENPKKIRSNLLKHIKKSKAFEIGNRALAIKKAILNADPQEIILVAGKGHEEKQIYKNKTLKISDKKIIKKFKFKNKIISKEEQNYIQNQLILERIIKKSKPVYFHGLSIDTRSIKKNNLFLALKGKKTDGNEFIYNALKKGAGCVVTSSKINKKSRKILKVKNPVTFLRKFAEIKREKTTAKVIAITGSAGKTSLKNLTKDLLKNLGKTFSSPKSFNNELGVPISLANLSVDDKFGVFEVGMSRAGEIKNLTKLIKPHIGVITNIGEAHLENFKDVNGIANAKSEIIEQIKNGGTIILNRDDKFFDYLFNKAKKFNLNISTFGFHKKSDIRAVKITKKKKFFNNFRKN